MEQNCLHQLVHFYLKKWVFNIYQIKRYLNDPWKHYSPKSMDTCVHYQATCPEYFRHIFLKPEKKSTALRIPLHWNTGISNNTECYFETKIGKIRKCCNKKPEQYNSHVEGSLIESQFYTYVFRIQCPALQINKIKRLWRHLLGIFYLLSLLETSNISWNTCITIEITITFIRA